MSADRARPDEAATLETLLASHRRFLAFLERRVRSREDAEEILQAAFVRALAREEPPDEETSVAWFYRVLRNALTDHYRRRAAGERALAARARAAAEHAEPDPELERAICACVGDLIPLLPPDYERILRRVDLEGAEPAAAARELGLTAGNARVRLHRARQALRRDLERSCGMCAKHGCLDCGCARR